MNIQDPMKHIHTTQAKIYEEQIVGKKVISINIYIWKKEKEKLNNVITKFSVNFGHHTFSFILDQMILNSTIPTLDPW